MPIEYIEEDENISEGRKAQIIAAVQAMINPPKQVFKAKEELLERYELIRSLEGVRMVESHIEIILRHYVYGDEIIADFKRSEIYKFCLEALCDTARQGGIDSKWLLGNELIKPCTHSKGYLADDMTLGNFLIVLAAHESHGSACDYMAHRYCDFNFDESITKYWLNKAQKSRWWTETGECLNLQLRESTEFNGMFIYLENISEK